MSINEAVRSVYGAWLLFRREPMGLAWFDTSLDGFWRSFQAAFLAAPAYAVILLFDFVERSGAANSPHPLRYLLVQTIAYVVSWTAFPLLMVSVTRLIDREAAYLRYMTAYNWGNVIVIGLSLPMALLAASGVLPSSLTVMLRIIVLLLILSYQGYIATQGLEVQPVTAAMIVMVDFTLGIFIISVAESLS